MQLDFVTAQKKLLRRNVIFGVTYTVQIWSFFWSVFSRIQSEYKKIQTKKNSVFGNVSRSVKDKKKNDRSSRPEFFYKKGGFKSCKNTQPANLFKKPPVQVFSFSFEFC